MRRLIGELRKRTDAPLWVFFDDLPSNDFNRLFANLYPVGAPALKGPDIFTAAIGASAFGRVVPEKSIQIATTYNAIGFLERLPEQQLPDFVLPMAPGPGAERGSVANSDQAPFRQQAHRDLCAFYRARASELTSGARLLVQVFGRNANASTSHGIYDVLNDAIVDLIDAGRFTDDFYRALIFPVYFRDLGELTIPCLNEPDLIEDFELERAETIEIEVPFNRQLTIDGDRGAWARRYTGFLRAFTEPVLTSALAGAETRVELIDALYERVRERLEFDPARYRFRYLALGALLRRR
jgi:hypothetical protein